MRLILLTILLSLNIAIKPQIIVGYYYGNYSGYPHSLIDYNCLTHIAHAFIMPDSSGTFHYPDWFPYPELIKSAHDNDKKIVVSVGGWGNSDGFKPMAADSAKRTRFINELVQFIKLYEYDGADIDWEYPRADERENYTSLISELREAFDIAGIEILSAALPAMDWNDVFDIEVLAEKFSWFGIMTYDFYGPWEKITGHNTALYSTGGQRLSVDASIKHYINKGVPLNKLCMGMEFAGYQMNADSLYKTHNGGRSISYSNSLKKNQDGWIYNWDSRSKTPYYLMNDSLITIDDSSSIRYKADYIVEHDLAGTIIWKLGLDYNNGVNELINLVGDRLFSVSPGKTELELPRNFALVDISDLQIRWNRSRAADKYLVQISESADFKKIVFEGQTASEFFIPELDPLSIYYCRVRGENNAGKGDWSESVTFSTYNSSDLLNTFEIFSFFPKEFSDEINLFIHSASTGKVKIKLFSIYNEEMLILEDELKEEYSIRRFNLSHLPEGEYEFRMIYEEGTLSCRIKI